MPRVNFVKKARKANRDHGIKKGDSYYWWKFRRGGKRVSKTRPKPSQLTQSEFLSTFLAIGESLEHADVTASDVENALGELETLIDETQSKIDNLESAWPNGCPAIETLQEYLEQAESAQSDLESAKSELEDAEGLDDDDDDKETQLEAARESVHGVSFG